MPFAMKRSPSMPDFWTKFTHFLETKGEKERDVLYATTDFLTILKKKKK